MKKKQIIIAQTLYLNNYCYYEYWKKKKRVRGDLIQVFRIEKGFDRINVEDFLSWMTVVVMGWENKWKLHLLQIQKCYFSQKVISSQNMLPEYDIDAPSVNSFKNRLDEWLTDVEIQAPLLSTKLQVTS